MTKSTITRERIQRIIRAIDSEAFDEEEIRGWLSSDEIMELTRIALASLEAEAVAYMIGGHYLMHAQDPKVDNYTSAVPLYTAPPMPVSVPDDVMAAIQKVARIRLDLNEFDGDKRGIAESLGEAEEALIEVVNRRAAMLRAEPVTTANKLGNSPLIPDGYVMVPKEPTAEMVNKMRYHVGGYDRNIKEGYKAMLAAAPQEVK